MGLNIANKTLITEIISAMIKQNLTSALSSKNEQTR